MHNQVVSRDEWLNARLALLAQEKELTRLSDEVARRRQELPRVRVDKMYRFDTDDGVASLADLFGGVAASVHHLHVRIRLLLAVRPADDRRRVQWLAVHLANHDVAPWAVSARAAGEAKTISGEMGWTFPGPPVRREIQLRFQRPDHREQQRAEALSTIIAAATTPDRGAGSGARRPVRGVVRNRRANLHARSAGHERFRDRGWRYLPHLFHLLAWTGWTLGRVSMARPSAQGAQRKRRLVASPRRI